MKFISTRGKSLIDAQSAILNTYPKEGGVFVPEYIPTFSLEEICNMCEMDFAERTTFILSKFFEEFDKDFIYNCCTKAFKDFDEGDPAPLVGINDSEYFLELYHGKTYCAQDIACALIKDFLLKSVNNSTEKHAPTCLFFNADNAIYFNQNAEDFSQFSTYAFVDGNSLSDIDKILLSLSETDCIYSIKGSFQSYKNTLIKSIINSDTIKSICSFDCSNILSVLTKTVYYFSAYCDLLDSELIERNEQINFAVNCDDFEEVLACYYAKEMGLPINKIIISHTSSPIANFLKTGKYTSDAFEGENYLINENVERFIFEITKRNPNGICELFNEFKTNGTFSISGMAFLTSDLIAIPAPQKQFKDVIFDYFDEYGYLLNESTASQVLANDIYNEKESDGLATVYIFGDSPYKTPVEVYFALSGKKTNVLDAVKKLFFESGMEIPEKVAHLQKEHLNEINLNTAFSVEEITNQILK